MFTVCLIGPDGVGKTTIAKHLEKSFPHPVKYLYMGVNAESSNYMLPTTRWWENRKRRNSYSTSEATHADENNANKSVKIGLIKGFFRSIIKAAGFVNRVLEEWYRQAIANSFKKKGCIVIFDRHFVYDYYHDNIVKTADSTFKQQLHGFFLKHFLAKPDLVICLDAPGDVVFKRKGEFTPEYLETRRNQYASLSSSIDNFAIVNANQALGLVIKEVTECMMSFYDKKTRNG